MFKSVLFVFLISGNKQGKHYVPQPHCPPTVCPEMYVAIKFADLRKFCQTEWMFINLIILANFSQISLTVCQLNTWPATVKLSNLCNSTWCTPSCAVIFFMYIVQHFCTRVISSWFMRMLKLLLCGQQEKAKEREKDLTVSSEQTSVKSSRSPNKMEQPKKTLRSKVSW